MNHLENKTREELISEIERLTSLIPNTNKGGTAFKPQEDTFNLIFETIPYAVNLLNESGIILECNKSLVELHGYDSKSELIGKHYSMLFPESEIERTISDITKIKEKGTVHGLRYRLKSHHQWRYSL